MWKSPASILGRGVAALMLIGCAAGPAGAQQRGSNAPPSVSAYTHVYTADAPAPAAILVILPGPAAIGDGVLFRNPALWAAQGFDVVMPQPQWVDRMVADQEAVVESLLASARTLANAPIWLVGSSPVIETAMPQAGNGVSGVVVTSGPTSVWSCSESVTYYNPGNGAAPQVTVKRSGNACGASSPIATGPRPSVAPAAPRPNAPRIIEASNPPRSLSPAERVRRLAELIKGPPG
jgi:hypothetical protein